MLLALLAFSPGARASGETADASLELAPRDTTFYSNAFSPADWRMRAEVSAPNPPNTALLPTRKITLRLPDKTRMRFQPPSVVCPNNLVGPPPTNVSVPVPTIVARCPGAVVGNGEATFLLAGNNMPGAELQGQVVLFNGGMRNGNPLVKFYAFSYSTNVGIYTEGELLPSGQMNIEFPVLSYDSAVNSLDVSIPSRDKNVYIPVIDKFIKLPGGQASGFVQARCLENEFPFSADFLLGERLQDGTPTGPAVELNNIGSAISCTGEVAQPRLEKPVLLGSSKPKRKATYRVHIQNSGYAALQGVRVVALGAQGSVRIGPIAGRSSRTVRLPVQFSRSGKVRLGVRVSSQNGGSLQVFRTVRVS